ncbi:hypothetical protein DASC09_026820 [Saccharomycopsis crataegensis]|uniref:HotDog ACOT-type domain-containing protein n=1 Tax=Saccharomycopsis crataegensis TaxID=43959 RepID=A0AAV5QL57_9ASCO|nr:hypothetical protein DASC09_026820 [Saccharomycopsis crataegensis]
MLRTLVTRTTPRVGYRHFSRSLIAAQGKPEVSDYLDKASEAPDATATILNDLIHEAKRIQSQKSATWFQALTERQKQLASGKVLDSYSYTTAGTADIKEKKRADSFSFLLLPFKEDQWLLDSYINAFGRLKVGQLFQDLDALAGTIAYKHTSPAEPMIVTASVDRICMLQRVDEISKYNLMVSGSVVWVGRSSMEISIKASFTEDAFPPESEITEDFVKDENVFLSANFTFVARNPETHRSTPINRFLPLNEKEWVDYTRAESHNAAKKLRAKDRQLTTNVPTTEETELMHNLWKASTKLKEQIGDTGIKPKNLAFMNDTVLKSVMFMQPQYRNRHSYMIFGGYLMKQAFELAYCNSAAFSHAPPRFISLDATSFTNPVPVGSVLYLKSKVVYTEHIPESDPEAEAANHSDAIASDPHTTDAQLDEYFKLYGSSQFINMSNDPKDFLNKAGTIVQVKVDTSVRSLNHDAHQKTGTFIYSFFVPKYSYENENLGVGNQTVASGREVKNGHYAVVPESYSDMINFIEGKRRAKETAESFKQLRQNI